MSAHMERFSYVRAASTAEAVTLLNEPGVRSRPLAGGTDLVLITRSETSLCDRVVDITQIPELHHITLDGNRVVIGAAATFSEVIESQIVSHTAPVLTQACRQVGATQIRNMGTLGGNVANAAACADSLPALVCLNAVARVLTPRGEHEWLVSELVRGPNRTMPRGRLAGLPELPTPPPGSKSVFLKLGRRNGNGDPRLTVAALGRLDESGQNYRGPARSAQPRRKSAT
jgi:CO/xanthine dehydrogenase FAD-binding subunit